MSADDVTAPLLVRADARALPLADESIDLIVTSPPYWALRSYTDGGEHLAGQLGDEPTPQEFLAELVECTREMVRVLKPSGSIFINLGDKYAADARGPNGSSSALTNGAQYRVTSPREDTTPMSDTAFEDHEDLLRAVAGLGTGIGDAAAWALAELARLRDLVPGVGDLNAIVKIGELDRLRAIEKRAQNLVTINEQLTSRTARVILGEPS